MMKIRDLSSHCTREWVSTTSCFISSHSIPRAVIKGALQSSRCLRGQGQVSRAEHHFRGLFLLLQDTQQGHHCLLFSSLYSLPAWFSQIRKAGFSFAGPDCSSLLPSHIESHRRVFIQGNLCRESPPWSLWSTGFVLPQLQVAGKLLSTLSPAKAAVPAPAVMSLILPAQASLHTCTASALGMSQPCCWWHMGFPWSCHPVLMLEAAPLSPQLVGLIPASSSTGQISQHRNTSSVTIFPWLLVTN